MVERITGKRMRVSYSDAPRIGDHICYYTDLTKVKQHYPSWTVRKPLGTILEEIAAAWAGRAVMA